VRAIEDVDVQGRLLPEAEREQLEREAFEASRESSGRVEPARYLQQRARRVLAAVEDRDARVAALRHGAPWRRAALVALPLLACAAGVVIDRIGNPHEVNMLSPPLLGVLAWNLAVYLLIAVSPLLPEGRAREGPLAGLQRWFAGLPRRGERGAALRADVVLRFHQHWWRAAGRQQWLWGKELLHLCAGGWALGLAISILVGGLVREYRVGWESTLLDVGQVHAILSALFAPVVALLPFDAFSVADLQRMAFRAHAQVGVEEARRWVWMYVALLALIVIVPRALLAAWDGWRRRRGARAIRIDLQEPYYAQLLERVRPARVTLGLLAPAGPGRETVLRMLRQLAREPQPRGAAPWLVLETPRGDTLRVVDVPPGFDPPAPLVTAYAGGAAAAQAWLHDLLGRFKAAPRAQRGDAVQAMLAEADLLLLVPTGPGDLAGAKRLLHWLAQPALVLAPDDAAPYREAVQRLGLAADVLPLAGAAGHWQSDPVWLDAAGARLPSAKRPGFQRLVGTWKERSAERFGLAMRLVATELVRAARDAEKVEAAPTGLRQLVSAGEREAAQRARDAARAALLQRVREGEAAVLAEFVRLYRAGEAVAPIAPSDLASGFTERQPVDGSQAGMAGAATGAAMGAGVDLLAGGLTLGAAAALGAMIGGGAAYAAAAWKNRQAPSGQLQVQIGPELLLVLAQGLLLAYVAVAHRTLPATGAELPVDWHDEVVAAVDGRRADLLALFERARGASETSMVTTLLAGELEALARGLLARL
jgi:hypothetical protein